MTNRPTRISWAPEADSGRLSREKQFHDEQAAERSSCPRFSDNLNRSDEWYLRHASWIAKAIECLGPVFGKYILDWGCGHGMASTLLARRGAHVVATDLSGGYCREASLRATAQEQQFAVVQADGIRLPFPDSIFDGIWGHAILHHLNTDLALAEISRVLKPDGRFVLCDPFEGSFSVHWARRLAGWSKGHRTEDEKPLNWSALSVLRRTFPNAIATFWDIPGVMRGRIPGSWPGKTSFFQSFSRYVVVTNEGLALD